MRHGGPDLRHARGPSGYSAALYARDLIVDWNLGLAALGIVLSVASIGYAVYVTRKSKREKRLAYELLPPLPIATVLSKESGYSLKVFYERPGQSPRPVQQAILRFTSFGQEPIRSVDNAHEDPIRVEITGGAVLDAAVVAVTRPVCGVRIGDVVASGGVSTAIVSFDFLDHLDGAIVQVITDSQETGLSLRGTVIGMPGGIRKARETEDGQEVSGWGCIIPLLVQVAALGAVPLLYHRLTGTWQHVWYLLLPVAALAIPLLLFLTTLMVLTPRAEFRFPVRLSPPDWYTRHLMLRVTSHRGVAKREAPSEGEADG